MAIRSRSVAAPERSLRFSPRVNAPNFRCLFSTGTAWGVYSHPGSIEVHGGTLELSVLVARREDGACVTYAPSINHHESGVLDWSVWPGALSWPRFV